MSAFARATAVDSLGDGAWSATCEPSWNTQLGPNGGYLAAIILRAMTAELDDPAREARSLTSVHFRAPAAAAVILEDPVLAVFRSSTAAGGFFDRSLASAEELRAFAEPGWVRVATAFTAAPDGDGCRMRTETRIAATDDTARRRFGRYWRLIGPFSSITRREMLAGIRRRAEA